MPMILNAYALTVVLLAFNLWGLWLYSGITRARSGVAVNPEDSKFGAKHDPVEPESVQRVLRAHANAQAATTPFLALGLVYMLLGGSNWLGTILFAVFVVARYAHAFVYLKGLSPGARSRSAWAL